MLSFSMAIKGRRATFDERVSACEALENGVSVDDIAQVLKVSRSSIFDWQKTYRAHGPDALRTKKTRGPRSKLDDGQLSQLYRLIVGNDPRQLSFGLALWTRGMIQELIFRQFGVRLSLVRIGAVLANLGLSPRHPLYLSYEGIRKEEFLEFCKMLTEDMGRPVFLILDNRQVHRSKSSRSSLSRALAVGRRRACGGPDRAAAVIFAVDHNLAGRPS
jgi:transposase